MTRRNQLISDFINGEWMNISFNQLKDAERIGAAIEQIVGEITVTDFEKYYNPRFNTAGKLFGRFTDLAGGINAIACYSEDRNSLRVIYEHKFKTYYVYFSNGRVEAKLQMNTRKEVKDQINQFVKELEFDDTYLAGVIIWNTEIIAAK